MLRKYKYDVSISVAKEDEAIAQQITSSLKHHKVTHYLYNEQNVEAWGEYVLKVSLAKYGAESKFILLIVSKTFVIKYWTIVELQIAQAFKKNKDAYILPLRIDETPVEGLKYIGFVTWKNNPDEVANMLKSKVQQRNRSVFKKRSLILGIVLLATFFGYILYPNNPMPDYSKYFDSFKKGDSLFTSQNIPAARESYRQSLQYNPNDKAALRKLSLLDSIDHFIRQRKDDSVKHIFEVIVNIPVSPSLSPEALKKAGVKNNPPIKLILSWKDGVLQVNITGGVPFDNVSKPYIIIGIQCSNCVIWKKEGDGYLASIPGDKVNVVNIGLKDRLGQFLYQPVPFAELPKKSDQKTPTVSISPPVPRPSIDAYIRAGDSLFGKRMFMEAKSEYQQAEALKPENATIAQKIKSCDEELQKIEEDKAKNIPRITIPAGSFTMGIDNGNADDGPSHLLNLLAFSMSRTEVTVAQYKFFCKYTGSSLPPGITENDENNNIPVTNITWNEAMAYCHWVGGRLPTEAEWEYAASAGSKYIYSGGNQIDQIAWYKNNASGKPAPVGAKLPNGYKLYDLTGNVSEWCLDWYEKTYYSKSASSNPKGPASGSEKVIRGGSYNSFVNSTQDGNQLRITYRNREYPTARRAYIGFRVVWNN